VRFIKNLKWLFNHPPTSLVAETKPLKCEFCDATSGIWNFEGEKGLPICIDCISLAFRKIMALSQPAESNTADGQALHTTAPAQH
jgi:hypothetical protein